MNLIFTKNREGGSLFLEIVIGVAIISIIFLAAAKALQTLHKSITSERVSSVLHDLAQQKINEYKKRSYNALPVIPSPTKETDPITFFHDPVNFPVETVSVGAKTYQIYTIVEKPSVGFNPMTTFADSDDLGLKQITVTVTSTINNKTSYRQATLQVQDPHKRTTNGKIIGSVKDNNNAAVGFAQVFAMEQPAYYVSSDFSGNYSLSLPHGTWTVMATKFGYKLDVSAPITVSAVNATKNFILNKSTTTFGYAHAWLYFADRPLISQVGIDAADVNYVELFNPLTVDIPLSEITLKANLSDQSVVTIVYPSSSSSILAAQHFYLIAMGPTIGAKSADIVTTTNFLSPSVGGLQLTWQGKTDAVGWYNSNLAPRPSAGYYETTAIGVAGGLVTTSQFTRAVSTGTFIRSYAGDTNLYGAAYDSGTNTVDFSFKSLASFISPNTAGEGSTILAGGTPALYHKNTGYNGCDMSYFWGQDGYSPPATVYNLMAGVYPVTMAYISSIATGTVVFNFQADNGLNEQYKIQSPFSENVANLNPFYIPTTKPWPAARTFAPILMANTPSTTLKAHISIAVKNRGGDSGYPYTPLTFPDRPGLVYTDVSGVYRSIIDIGSNPIVINAGPSPIPAVGPTETMDCDVVHNIGPITDVFFGSRLINYFIYTVQDTCLIEGTVRNSAWISGVLTDSDVIPNIYMVAIDSTTGSYITSAMTDDNGLYSLRLLTNRRYIIRPQLESGQVVNAPVSGSYFIDTTGKNQGDVLGANDFSLSAYNFSTISGMAVYDNQPILEGVLVMVSTFTLTGDINPPALTPEIRARGLILYSGVTDGEGKYKLSIPAGNGYVLSSWYGGVKKEVTNITVLPNATTNQDVLWP